MKNNDKEKSKLYFNDYVKTKASSNVLKDHMYKLFLNDIEHKKYKELSDIRQLIIFENTIKKINSFLISYYQYSHLFKAKSNLPISDSDYFKLDNFNTIEDLHDYSQKIIEKNKIKKYAHSFLRSYKKLLDEESYEIFKTLYYSDISREQIQNDIRKLASFETPEQLNNALRKIGNNFSYEAIIKKMNKLNSDIIYDQNGYLLIKINNFQDSQALGSSQWCISTDEMYYDDYLTTLSDKSTYLNSIDDIEAELIDLNRHLFYFDFNKKAEDPLSQIGVTISRNGDLIAAHDKNDKNIVEEAENLLPLEMKEIVLKTFPLEDLISAFEINLNSQHLEEILITDYEFLSELSRHPLHMLRNFYNNRHDSESVVKYFINPSILENSLKDFLNYKDLHLNTFLQDIFWGIAQSKDFLENHNNQIEDIKTEFLSDFYEHNDDIDRDYIDDEFQNYLTDNDIHNMELDFHGFVDQLENFFEKLTPILESVKELTKFTIYKQHCDLIYQIFEANFLDYENSSPPIDDYFYSTNTIFLENNPFTLYYGHQLYNNSYLNEPMKYYLRHSFILQGNQPSEEMRIDFINDIKNNKTPIHNVLLFNNYLDNEIKSDVFDYIKSNPEKINDIKFNKLSQCLNLFNEPFFQNSDHLIKKYIRNNIEKNIINISHNGITTLENINDYSLLINVKHAINNQLIKESSVSKLIDFSKVNFGSINKYKEYYNLDNDSQAKKHFFNIKKNKLDIKKTA